MNHSIVDVMKSEFATCRSQVALLIVVTLEIAVDAGGEGIRADVELPSVVEQWIVDVLLDDASSLLRLRAVGHDLLDFFVVFGDLNSLTSVRVLSRFENPHVQLLVVHPVVVVVREVLPVLVGKTILDVERDRQRIKWVLVHGLIVGLHIDEESLLVAQVVVIFYFIVQLEWEWLLFGLLVPHLGDSLSDFLLFLLHDGCSRGPLIFSYLLWFNLGERQSITRLLISRWT